MRDPEDGGARRHSVAGEPSLVFDPEARARVEARNGLRQFDLGIAIIEDAKPARVEVGHQVLAHVPAGIRESVGKLRSL